MSFVCAPDYDEKAKKYGWPDREHWHNSMNMGVEFVNGEMCVTYLRHPTNNLLRKLAQPVEDAKAHIYQPLPPGYVRFLRRCGDSGDNRIVFEFVTCQIDDASTRPSYSAVSYCWGDLPADSHVVLADGSFVRVSTKVASILALVSQEKWIRHVKGDIWLDAVCIDQSKPVEKASQIPLMASIYKHASQVEVWLGDGSEGIDDGLQELYGSSRLGDPRAYVVFDYDNGRSDPYSLYQPNSIGPLIWSSWFERAWVAQEFCFGSKHRYHFKNATLMEYFLHQVLEWGDNPNFSRFIDEEKGHCQLPMPPMLRNFTKFLHLRRFLKTDTGTRLGSLEDVLCALSGLKATDPRDKIFSVLNFVNKDARDDVKINYTREAADIYHDAMESVLFRGSQLRLFGLAGLTQPRPLLSKRPDIPSWVPDFSASPVHTVWSNELGRFQATTSRTALIKANCMHLKIPLEDKTHTVPFIMPTGQRIDKIASVIPGNKDANLVHLPRLISEAMKRVQSSGPYPVSDETPREILWKTLIASNPDCMKRDPTGKGFDQLYELVKTCLNAQDEQGRRLSPSAAFAVEGQYFHTMLTEGTGSTRGLFWTEGGLVGIAANGVEVGDEVFLLGGARVPFILRQTEAPFRPTDLTMEEYTAKMRDERPDMVCSRATGVYSLMCEAYVHGIMHAEADLGEKESTLILF